MINKTISNERKINTVFINEGVFKPQTGTPPVFSRSNNALYDVTDKNTDLPLGKLAGLYKHVTEVTNDCLWEWDLTSKKILWIDGGHKRVFGYPIENKFVSLAFWKSCIHPDDRTRVISTLNKTVAAADSKTWEDEYRFKNVDGSYLYVHDRAHILYDVHNNASRMIGATQDITEKVLLKNKLDAERNDRQKEMTEAILTAQENERAEIGRELHDNLGQILAVSKMYLQLAVHSEYKRQENINKTMEHIMNVMTELRRIAYTLVIPPTHIVGLFGNIRNLVTDLSVIHPLKIAFSVQDITETSLSRKLQVTIFRIVQEQVNNILRHSGAETANIKLSMKDGNVVLLISDNGSGCDTKKRSNGVGLINIISRAEINYGSVTIRSKEGKGYLLKVNLPLITNIAA
jgi:two-component system sensor histidine kinase UhpB